MARRALVLAALLALAATAIGGGAAASVDPVDPIGAPAGGGPITEHEMLFGPFELDEMGTGHWQDAGEGAIPRPPGAYGLTYVLIDVVDDQGTVMTKHQVHLHHFVAASVNEPDPLCDRTALTLPVRPVWGSGGERTPIAFPSPYALEVEADDLWGATWHLMNMTDQKRSLYVRYRLGVQPGATAENTRFVTPYFLDVAHGAEGPGATRPCGPGTYDVPGDGGHGSEHVRSNAWTIPDAGIIVGAGAHLHGGGLAGVLRDAADAVLCHSMAVYAGGSPPHGHGTDAGSGDSHLGTLDTIQPCLLHHEVPAGERMTYEVRYDNSHPEDDVMGMMMMFIWHGRQVATTTTSTTTTTVPPTTTSLPPGAAQPIVAAPSFTG